MHQGKSIIAASLGFLVPAGAAFLLLPEIINNLGPGRFAYFSNLYSYSTFLLMLDLGISAGISRRVAAAINSNKKKTRAPNLIWSAVIAQALIALIVVIGSAIFSLYIDLPSTDIPKSEIIIAYAAITISAAPAMFCSVFRGAFEGSGKHYSASVIRVSSGITALLVPAILPLFSKDLGLIFMAILALRIVIALVAGLTIFKFFGRSSLKNKRKLIKYIKILLSESAVLSLGHLAGSLITLGLIDRAFLTVYMSSISLIDYVIPRDMIIRLILIPASICVVLMPFLSGKYDPKQTTTNDFRKLELLFSAQAWPICGIIVFWSESFIYYISNGTATVTSIQLTILMTLGVFLYLNSFIYHTILISTGNIWISAKRHLIQLPIIIAFSFYFSSSGNIEALGWLWFAFCISDVIMTYTFCYNLKLLPNKHKPFSKMSLILFIGLIVLLFLSNIDIFLFKMSITSLLIIIIALNINYLRKKKEVFGFEY